MRTLGVDMDDKDSVSVQGSQSLWSWAQHCLRKPGPQEAIGQQSIKKETRTCCISGEELHWHKVFREVAGQALNALSTWCPFASQVTLGLWLTGPC